MKSPRSYVFALALTTLAARAQDYPYSDEGDPAAEAPAPKAAAKSSVPDIPREGPDAIDARTGQLRRLPALFRVGVKAGAEYTTFQALNAVTGLSTTLRGPGFSGLVSFGWDLPYQPIFIEFETGYRALLANRVDRIHVIPLQAGIYRRVRSGPHNLVKFGFAPSIDVRMARQANGTMGFSAVPSLAFNVVFEWGGFLLQPGGTLYRLRSGENFVSFGALAGYRF